MHLKRTRVSKNWPIARKGSKFVAVSNHAKKDGISLLVLIRDVLGLARTRKEVKFMIHNGDVKVNNVTRKDDGFPVQFFDVVEFEKLKKAYRLVIVNRKFKLEEVSGKEKDEKIVKIVGKKVLGKGNIQMNLQNGGNFLVKEKFSVGDSVVLNTKEKKIVKLLPLKAGAKIEIISGKHAGEKGEVKEIVQLKRTKDYHVKLEGKEVGVPLKTLIVIG